MQNLILAADSYQRSKDQASAMERQEQVIKNLRDDVLKTQTEHEGCQDKVNLLEARLHSYEEEVERLKAQVAAAERRELDSRTEAATLKKALETSGAKAVEAYKSSREFDVEKEALFDEAVKCLLSCIWGEHPEWDLTFVNPNVVPDLIAEFAREREQEEAEIAALEQGTRGASSSVQPPTDEQLDLTQVADDSVEPIQPDDDVAP